MDEDVAGLVVGARVAEEQPLVAEVEAVAVVEGHRGHRTARVLVGFDPFCGRRVRDADHVAERRRVCGVVGVVVAVHEVGDLAAGDAADRGRKRFRERGRGIDDDHAGAGDEEGRLRATGGHGVEGVTDAIEPVALRGDGQRLGGVRERREVPGRGAVRRLGEFQALASARLTALVQDLPVQAVELRPALFGAEEAVGDAAQGVSATRLVVRTTAHRGRRCAGGLCRPCQGRHACGRGQGCRAPTQDAAARRRLMVVLLCFAHHVLPEWRVPVGTSVTLGMRGISLKIALS